MDGNTSVGLVGDQDLVYGFDPKNVAASLTARNWKRKAIIRQDRHGLLYAWVWKRRCEKDGKKWVDYAVKVKRLEGEGGRDYERIFDNVEDALRYANGEDGSVFSKNTRAMGKMMLNERGAQLFGAHPAHTIFSVMGIGHKLEIPGPEDQVQPDGYACFLTEVLESILAVSPGMSKYLYKQGITLHPDVEGRKSYRPSSDLPKRITVRCYKTEKAVVGKFHVFPKDRAAGGLMPAVRIDGPKGQAGKKVQAPGKKASPKGKARS